MTLLKELFEAAEGPLELTDLITSFPTKYSNALHKVWGTRLQFQGQPWAELYAKAAGECENYIVKGDDLFQKDFTMEDKDGDVSEFTADLLIDSAQEVYCGINLDSPNELYFGFDVWFSDEDVWETFYKAFKKEYRTSYDEDNSDHADISDRLWKEQLSKQVFGVLVKVKFANGKIKLIDVVTDDANDSATFYQSIYKSREFKALNLKDIRLD